MGHRHYSHEEIRQAHEVDMVEFLENYLGMEHGFYRSAGGEYRSKEHSGLAVHPDGRQWSWFSHAIDGNDAIDFLQRYEKMTFYDAVEVLLREYPVITNVTENRRNCNENECETPSPLLFEPDKSSSYRRLYAYLTKTRCIDREIVCSLIHDDKMYQDERGNIVFRGFDEFGNVRYATRRGTYSGKRFCRECRGSDKRYGFRFGDDRTDMVYVFESPIDGMSHATMELHTVGEWKEKCRLSLGGVSDAALEEYLRTHPHVKKIILCLDNDESGNSAADKMMRKYDELGYSVERETPRMKDFNEDLCNFGELRIYRDSIC